MVKTATSQNGDTKTATISQNSDRSKISVIRPKLVNNRLSHHIGICYCIYRKIQQCQYINMTVVEMGLKKMEDSQTIDAAKLQPASLPRLAVVGVNSL